MIDELIGGVLRGIEIGLLVGIIGFLLAFFVIMPMVEKLAKLIEDANVKQKVQKLLVKWFYKGDK
jgi:hypothetical protein